MKPMASRRTVGERKAQIAKRPVGEDPALISPERRVELLEKIETIYARDRAVVVTLSDEEMAFAQMTVSHEDDLPKA
jgi:hypothetical protein